MAQKLDQIIVVDIEATCWEGKVPSGMESDIIEIGICLLDIQCGAITANQAIMVKPERSEISTFCTALTTITSDMLKDAISFKEACALLKNDYQ